MFIVGPEEIVGLGDLKLVQLLRVLMYAEARKSGVPLRHVDVPLQITVADGGKDASVLWDGGVPSTEYFPTRDVVFQCKAKDGGDAQWKKEVWTKGSQRTTVTKKVLNDAVTGALDRGGCYIGITATPLVGTKAADRAAAIRAGIKQAGGDASKLAAVEVYDANKLAAWASDHPAVAVWIKEQAAGKAFSGFATIDQWGRRADIASPAFVPSDDREFSLGSGSDEVLKHSQLAAKIVDYLADDRACIRIWGASGIGKSRALYQALNTSVGLIRDLAAANYIFCDFQDGSSIIREVANGIVKTGQGAVLVIDNCPFEDAVRLNDLARGQSSQLRVITIGAEGRDKMDGCLMIRPLPADRRTIEGILAPAMKGARRDEIEFVAKFCDGFPQIAVQATESYQDWQGVLKSADNVAENIIKAANFDRDTVRSLECLSLFDHLEPENSCEDFDAIAEKLAHTSGGMMFEHLVVASEQHFVGRQGGHMTTQPRPIADYLAVRRLSYLRHTAITDFLLDAKPAQRRAMLARWQHLGRSAMLVKVAQLMLRGCFSAPADLLGESAAEYLVAFAHVDPDQTAMALSFAVIQTSLDDLAKIEVSQELIDALRLLAMRSATFEPIARIVIRLAAVAEHDHSSPAVELLRSLFQVALAGTEANDRERQLALRSILDEDDDVRIAIAGVEALAAMLRTHVSRSGELEQIGSEGFRSEWRPADSVAISNYFEWSLGRLHKIWRNMPSLRSNIEELVAHELRGLLGFEILPAIAAFVKDVVAANGHFFEATKTIGDWLYFDRPNEETRYGSAVRELYDATLPSDPVEQAILYSKFWTADIHDPDQRYSEMKDRLDFEFTTRAVRALAPRIAVDPDMLSRAIELMSREEMKTPFPFAEALVEHTKDPLAIFGQALATLDASGSRNGVGFVRALLTSIDRKLADQPDKIEQLVTLAEQSPILAPNRMDIFDALRVTPERLAVITAQVREGTIEPRRVVSVSYGRGLDGIAPAAFASLIQALVERPGSEGAWAALEILSMYTHEMKKITGEVAKLVKLAILSPAIAESSVGHSGMSEYVHERLLKMLADDGEIDESFARGFAAQIEASCRGVGGRYSGRVDAIRSALATVVEHQAAVVWAVLSGFYETATRAERERLNTITSAVKPFAFDVTRTRAGPLFATPKSLMLTWVDAGPDDRLDFLLSFYPVLENDAGRWKWHPALQELAAKYGGQRQFRTSLRARIFPSSWGGSLREHLSSFQQPLETWVNDPIIGDWAAATLQKIDAWLADDFHQ